MPTIQAVFFDLYETMVTELDPHWKPLPTTAERLGLRQERFTAEWRARQQKRMAGAYADYRSVLREICSATDHPVDEALIERLYAERLAAKAAPFAHVEDDIGHALEAIRRLGVKLGLISNCTAEEVASWECSTLRALFDDSVLSYQVGYTKPAIAIYHLACRRLDVQPERSIFVGDGGSDELWGATSAGMAAYKAAWFLSRWPAWKAAGHPQEQARYPVLQTPAELVAAVAAGCRASRR